MERTTGTRYASNRHVLARVIAAIMDLFSAGGTTREDQVDDGIDRQRTTCTAKRAGHTHTLLRSTPASVGFSLIT